VEKRGAIYHTIHGTDTTVSHIPTTSSNRSCCSIENAATTLKPRRKENTEQQQQQQQPKHTNSVNNKTSDLKGTQSNGPPERDNDHHDQI
jgi:hypothetical protein